MLGCPEGGGGGLLAPVLPALIVPLSAYGEDADEGVPPRGGIGGREDLAELMMLLL